MGSPPAQGATHFVFAFLLLVLAARGHASRPLLLRSRGSGPAGDEEERKWLKAALWRKHRASVGQDEGPQDYNIAGHNEFMTSATYFRR